MLLHWVSIHGMDDRSNPSDLDSHAGTFSQSWTSVSEFGYIEQNLRVDQMKLVFSWTDRHTYCLTIIMLPITTSCAPEASWCVLCVHIVHWIVHAKRHSSRYNLRHGAAGGARRGRALGGVHDAQTWRRGLPRPHPSRITAKLLQAYKAFRVQAEKARSSLLTWIKKGGTPSSVEVHNGWLKIWSAKVPKKGPGGSYK